MQRMRKTMNDAEDGSRPTKHPFAGQCSRNVCGCAAGFVFALALMWTAPSTSYAQAPAAGQFADQNVVPTPDRQPGAMVAAGVARAQSTLREPTALPNITATEPPRTVREQFNLQAIDIITRDALNALFFLAQRFFARAGLQVDLSAGLLDNLPTTTPPAETPDQTNTTGGTNGTGSAAADTGAAGDGTVAGSGSSTDGGSGSPPGLVQGRLRFLRARISARNRHRPVKGAFPR
ncbi:MAG: hypothetical protein D6788_04080 [Planctomycetota bacterium]|nr:MAG: hypothetical protein D6788_04080 [Planctomycetota bacterium]